MFKVGDRVSLERMGDAKATVAEYPYRGYTDMIVVVFDDPSVGHDTRFVTPGSWVTFVRELTPLELCLDYEVD